MTAEAIAALDAKVDRGDVFDRRDAEVVAACPDLPAIGRLGERLRKALRGDQVTFGLVCEVTGEWPEEVGPAGEIRLLATPASIDEARSRVREAASRANGIVLTAFSLDTLLELAGGAVGTIQQMAASLRADGLDAVASVPVDRFEHDEGLAALRAVVAGGLGAWRATVQSASDRRLEGMARAAAWQEATAAFRAFAPLPEQDDPHTPSTGYDDVRTVTMARMLCRTVPSIQVDWRRYGPKLAQVAIAYGVDDLDAVPAVDTLQLGRRRSPVEDIERQIRSAFAVPAERNGRYELMR